MLRADAIVSIYLVHPLLRWTSSPNGRVPILMYHSVSQSDAEHAHPYYRTVTTPEVFAQHMRFLHENGYSSVSLADVCNSADPPVPARSFVITFDDGFRDFYTEAFPILNRYGWNATVYLPTAYIGDTARTFKDKACLTWNQVRELSRAGVEFGSHTVTHPQLQTLNEREIESEVRQSKEEIEQQHGCAVRSFSYPYAFPETDRVFKGRLREMLEQAGYTNGVSTIIGTAHQGDDLFFLKRLPMNACDNARLIRAKLEGAYNWLHTIQYASKLIAAKRQKLNITHSLEIKSLGVQRHQPDKTESQDCA